MKLRVVVCVFALLSFLGVARGQDAKVDLFTGYSHVQANLSGSGDHGSFGLNGGEFSFAYNANSWLSGVADVGAYNSRGQVSTYAFGPRITYSHFGQMTPFSQVLFGVTHATSDVFANGR
jgi:hypothetical protein